MWLKSFLRWMAVSKGCKVAHPHFCHASHSKGESIADWFELENRPCIVAVPMYDSRLFFELLYFGIRPSSATSGSSRHTGVEDRFPREGKDFARNRWKTCTLALIRKDIHRNWNSENAPFGWVLSTHSWAANRSNGKRAIIQCTWFPLSMSNTVCWWPDLAVLSFFVTNKH